MESQETESINNVAKNPDTSINSNSKTVSNGNDSSEAKNNAKESLINSDHSSNSNQRNGNVIEQEENVKNKLIEHVNSEVTSIKLENASHSEQKEKADNVNNSKSDLVPNNYKDVMKTDLEIGQENLENSGQTSQKMSEKQLLEEGKSNLSDTNLTSHHNDEKRTHNSSQKQGVNGSKDSSEETKARKHSQGSHSSEQNTGTKGSVDQPKSSSSSDGHSIGSIPSSLPHMSMQSHDKSNAHLIPIPSLPNPMMSSAGMNLFPPMMNPYFQSMMFDPRMAAAFQQQMFRSMPPLHPRFQQAQPQRTPRARGPRGPRQNKSHQQSLPPETLRHHRPSFSDPLLKIDPLQDIPIATGHSKDHTTDTTHSSSSSRSSTPKGQSSMPSASTNSESKHSEGGMDMHQPPPAHSHGKIDIRPLPPGLMQMAHQHSKSDFPLGGPQAAHSHAKADMPPHMFGAAPPAHSHGHHGLSLHPSAAIQESLPPAAHSTHTNTALKLSSTPPSSKESHNAGATKEPNAAVQSLLSSTLSHSLATSSSKDSIPHETTANSTPDSLVSTSLPVTETVVSTPLPAHSHPLTTTVTDTAVSFPLPAHSHPMTTVVDSISSKPLPAHGQQSTLDSVSSKPSSTHSATTSATDSVVSKPLPAQSPHNTETSIKHTPELTNVPSTNSQVEPTTSNSLLVTSGSAVHVQSSVTVPSTNTSSLDSVKMTASTTASSQESPIVATTAEMITSSATTVSMATSSGETSINGSASSGTATGDTSSSASSTDVATSSSETGQQKVPTPAQSHPAISIPSSAGVPMSMPGNFPPFGQMHPGMAQHFMQQKVRGQKMGSKPRGPGPEMQQMPHGMPPGMMPQFGRFPPGFNPMLNPQIAFMARSPEMMALAQKMGIGGPTVSEGGEMPKLDPNQLEMLKNMRMRPPFGMRPGMPPRGMPPPRYPGLPMNSPTGMEGVPPRPHGMPPGLPTSNQMSVALTSPTTSVKSASESQSPHPAASPMAPSPHSSMTGGGDKTPSPVPKSPANSDTTSVGSTPIKQEPLEQRISSCFPDDDHRTASQNALLKQLLANSLAMGGGMGRPPGTPFSEDSEDGSILQLTPEQQKQLEMIESMPSIREVELTPEQWAAKTPEEREKILEIRKKQFEERKREFEDLRKKKKPVAEPRKRKKKEKSVDQMIPPDMFAENPMLMTQQAGPQPPPKKRQRRPKKKVDVEEDKDARVESFLAQLRMLPNVPLQEPKVTSAIVNSPVYGSAQYLTGESQLKGGFGNANLEGVADYYGSNPLGGLPPLGTLVSVPQPKDIDTRRKFLSDGQDTTEQQKDRIGPPLLGQHPPFSISSLTGIPSEPTVPQLPPPPRIEPRVHSHKMVDSPDTVISSSSPEHEFGDENPEFPMLKPIDPPMEEENRRCSPTLPLLQPVAIKAESLQDNMPPGDKKLFSEVPKPVTDVEMAEKKLTKLDPTLSALADRDLNGKTNSFTSSLSNPMKDKDISVTLTLSAKAAEDIGGVLSSIAELLKIAVPPTYQMRSPSPDGLKLNLKHKEDPINIHNLIKMKPKFCRNCDMVVMDKGYIRKKSEMPFNIKEDHFTFKESEDEDIAFCNQKCYDRFVMVYKSYFKPGGLQKISQDPTFLADKSPSSLSPFPLTPPTMISPRGSGFLTPSSSGEKTPQLTPTTPTGSSHLSTSDPSTPTRRVELEKPRKKKSDAPPKPPPKRWKNIRYKKWDPSFSQELQHRPETPKSEVEVLWKALGTIITPDPMPEDKRSCVFCQVIGDGQTDGTARLLNMDVDKWVHLNCALWSSEVYETLNGDLMNVDVAFKRGQSVECYSCKKLGATLGCFKVNCTKNYHLGCAQKTGCMFFQDKTILCPPHAPKVLPDNVLTNLSVYRKVYVNRDEDKQVASMIRGQEEGTYALRISSLILHSVGQLLPHQIATGKFHTRDFIYPVGFKSSRFYWSMRRLYKRCRYVCSISDNDGRPEFMIRVVEAGFEDIVMKDNSPRAVWFKVLEPLDKMRRNADLVKIFPSFMTGEELFGLTEPAIIRVIESLPGTDLLKNYAFKFGRCELIEMPLTINPTGCARTEPKLRTHFRKMHTLQSSHTSRSLPVMVTGVTGDINSPYMKQFVHSKSAQYRRLKTEWRTNVFLGRSRIQGLGLFAARDLEKHTMVIEYIGYLIRDEVANRLEMTYNEQNRGVYMFRIDSDQVVDATMAGGPARYINHSCDPNCVAEVVPFDKGSKIIIITNRRIPKGEELTYDYKFDFEDEQHKIPCCCGAKNCKKWMN